MMHNKVSECIRRTITWGWNFNANTTRHLHWNNETGAVALVIKSHFQWFKNEIKERVMFCEKQESENSIKQKSLIAS